MAQLFIQFAITFVGMEVIKNNLMEIFLPSVLLCNSSSFVTLFYTSDHNAVHFVQSLHGYLFLLLFHLSSGLLFSSLHFPPFPVPAFSVTKVCSIDVGYGVLEVP